MGWPWTKKEPPKKRRKVRTLKKASPGAAVAPAPASIAEALETAALAMENVSKALRIGQKVSKRA